MKTIISLSILCTLMIPHFALAEVCDYTPSQYIGSKATMAVEGAAVVTATTGVGLKVAGFYTITHATSGAVMIGSTAAGASAAGTTGIIASTTGLLGTAGAFILSPFVIIPAAIVAIGVGTYEGVCYFSSDKILEKVNKTPIHIQKNDEATN